MNEEELREMEVDAIINFIELNTKEFRYSGSRLFKIVFEKLEKISNKEKMKEIKHEILALDLSTHQFPEKRFSPMYEGKTENGEIHYYPNLEKHFTTETFNYYKIRISKSKNPLLKARYCDVLWEFKKEIRYAELAIETYLQCSEIYYENTWFNELVDSISRALQLSIQIKNEEKKERTMLTINDFIAKLDEKENFSSLYNILYFILDYQKKISNFLDKQKLNKIIQKSIQHYERKEDGYHFRRLFLDIALKIERSEKNEEEIHSYQTQIALSYEEEAEWKKLNFPKGNVVAASIYEQALQKYIEIGASKQKIDEIKNKIASSLEDAKKTDFIVIKAQSEIPMKKILKYLERFKNLTVSQICDIILIDKSLIPSYDKCNKDAIEAYSKYVFRSLIPDDIIFDTIKISTVSSKDEKIAYDTIKNFQSQYYGVNILLEEIFNLLEEEHPNYYEGIIKYFGNKEIINSPRMEVVSKGLNFFYNKDYISAIHLLIFQLEGILRDILNKLGIPTFNYKNNEMRYKTLYDITMQLLSIDGFEQDLVRFIQIFMCDIRGDNLRNEISHGILKNDLFTRRNANILVLLLIKISAYQIVYDKTS